MTNTWISMQKKWISNEISLTLGVMNRLKRYLSAKILHVLYSSSIHHHHIQYAISSGDSSCSDWVNNRKKWSELLHVVNSMLTEKPICIRFMLLQILNDLDPSVTEKVRAYFFQGFAHWKLININYYATHCLIPNFIYANTHNAHAHNRWCSSMLLWRYWCVAFLCNYVYLMYINT